MRPVPWGNPVNTKEQNTAVSKRLNLFAFLSLPVRQDYALSGENFVSSFPFSDPRKHAASNACTRQDPPLRENPKDESGSLLFSSRNPLAPYATRSICKDP